ncbi:hypothetical protein TYRP_005427 [Tyrophagus putrescentiae]|nr:hypothetical protein TYRP_005427 [Tyrophagus putrescentiae]
MAMPARFRSLHEAVNLSAEINAEDKGREEEEEKDEGVMTAASVVHQQRLLYIHLLITALISAGAQMTSSTK